MKNITLAIDERLLEESREYAREHHTSLNAMVREMLAKRVLSGQGADWLDKAFELADKSHGRLKGWKWNREELYDRKVLR